ncbi:MAG: NAD(P)-binding domain-containing protein [Chthoniobacterales bacterium]
MSRRTERNVGVIGLGIIGLRVAESLRRRGFSVFVWNRTPRPFPNFVGSPAEIAQLADFIQIFVADDEALLEMVAQLKPALKAHHVVMAHCTVAPHTMRAAAEIVQRRGAQFLDAPFTGSKLAAAQGELVYYIGGDEVAFRRARPILEGSSKDIIEIGEIGQATTIKIATNMVTAATIQVAAEALALVDSAGLTPDKFVAAMKSNASSSPTLGMKLPKMVEGDFETHFSVKHMLKDMEIASRLARSYDLSLGATEAARTTLLAEMRKNRGDYDYSSMVHAFFPEGAAPPPAAAVSEPEHLTLDLKEASPPEPETIPEPEAPVLEESAAEPASAQEPLLIEDVSLTDAVTQLLTESEPAATEKEIVVESTSVILLANGEFPVDKSEIETAVATAAPEAEEDETPGEETSSQLSDESEDSPSLADETPAEEPAAETKPAPVPAVAEENVRRGFFSRMFSRTTDDRGADY